MHVLVTETTFGDADKAIGRLRALGHKVSTCHSREGSGACRVLAHGDICPLDGPRVVDLVVDVRPPGAEQITAREYGAVCAVRAGVPLAQVSTEPHRLPPTPDGFAGRTRTYRGGDLPLACTEAGHMRHTFTGRPA